MTNVATISSTTADINLKNNESAASTVIGNVANVYTLIDTPALYTLNQNFPFTVWYGNNGNIPADHSLLRIDLPKDVIYGSQTAGPVACLYQMTGNYLTCDLGTLGAGVLGQFDFLASISNNLGLLTG